jgi:hypothetical protein
VEFSKHQSGIEPQCPEAETRRRVSVCDEHPFEFGELFLSVVRDAAEPNISNSWVAQVADHAPAVVRFMPLPFLLNVL